MQKDPSSTPGEAMSSLIERPQQEREIRIFEQRLEQFFKDWAPEDRYEASQFHSQLHSLVRSIYHDAQEPVFKQLCLTLAIAARTAASGAANARKI